MKQIKLILGILLIACLAIFVIFALKSDHALVIHPKGIIAQKELKLIATSYSLMLIIVVPTLIALFVIAWKYRSKNSKAKYEPDDEGKGYRAHHDAILWLAPACIIAVMAYFTWEGAHKLDPYRPLESKIKPLEIHVVALDWKWLFIYPEQGIATVNFVQFPYQTPIHFTHTADGSPMNSFWIPELSGQIYSMTGMITPIHLMADGAGVYPGRAVEINGEGYAGMTFTAKSTSQAEFDEWVAFVRGSFAPLDYNRLLKPSIHHPVELYSYVEKDLFYKIVKKYTTPQ